MFKKVLSNFVVGFLFLLSDKRGCVLIYLLHTLLSLDLKKNECMNE